MKTTYRVAALAAMVLAGCQTNPDLELDPTQVPSTAEVLTFESLEAYDQFLSNAPEAQEAFFAEREQAGYLSYAAAHLTEDYVLAKGGESEEDLIFDPFYARLLNRDGVVHIGPWYIRVNKPTELVYALHESHYATGYSDLIGENLKNEHVLAFSTEDEVLWELQDLNESSTLAGRGELFCDNANGNKDTDNRWFTGTGVNQHDTFLRYHYYGLGFSLKAQAKWRERTGNDIFNEWDPVEVTNIVGSYNREYIVKCGKHPGEEWLSSTVNTTRVDNRSKWSYTFYNSTTKLSAYRAEMTISWTAPNGTRVSSKRMYISSGL